MDETTAEPIVKAYHQVFRGHGTSFIGDEGWVSVDRTAMYSSDHGRLRKIELKSTDARLPVSNDHFANFVECVRSRDKPVSPFEAAIRSDTISHLAEIVVRTERSLEWDPKSEKIKGSPADQVALLDRPVRSEYRF